jgi:predicted metal-dependent hydrolase
MYLRGLDLFNHGYYWEAHEVWESLWHACARRGRSADFLKGLIKLAAAGVKVREGRRRGVVDHARAAAELFRRIGNSDERYFGLRLGELVDFAEAVAGNPPTTRDSAAPVEIVFATTLRPESP